MNTYTEDEVDKLVEARVQRALLHNEETHISLKEHDKLMKALRDDCVRILHCAPERAKEVAKYLTNVSWQETYRHDKDSKILTVRLEVAGILMHLARTRETAILTMIDEICSKVRLELLSLLEIKPSTFAERISNDEQARNNPSAPATSSGNIPTACDNTPVNVKHFMGIGRRK